MVWWQVWQDAPVNTILTRQCKNQDGCLRLLDISTSKLFSSEFIFPLPFFPFLILLHPVFSVLLDYIFTLILLELYIDESFDIVCTINTGSTLSTKCTPSMERKRFQWLHSQVHHIHPPPSNVILLPNVYQTLSLWTRQKNSSHWNTA